MSTNKQSTMLFSLGVQSWKHMNSSKRIKKTHRHKPELLLPFMKVLSSLLICLFLLWEHVHTVLKKSRLFHMWLPVQPYYLYGHTHPSLGTSHGMDLFGMTMWTELYMTDPVWSYNTSWQSLLPSVHENMRWLIFYPGLTWGPSKQPLSKWELMKYACSTFSHCSQTPGLLPIQLGEHTFCVYVVSGFKHWSFNKK